MQDQVPLSSHLFSSMFAACAAAGTQEMLEAADRSHMDMEGLWNKVCGKGKTITEERQVLQLCAFPGFTTCNSQDVAPVTLRNLL